MDDAFAAYLRHLIVRVYVYDVVENHIQYRLNNFVISYRDDDLNNRHGNNEIYGILL